MSAPQTEAWTPRDVLNLAIIIVVAGIVGYVLWQILAFLAKVALVIGCLWLVCQFGATAGKTKRKEESK